MRRDYDAIRKLLPLHELRQHERLQLRSFADGESRFAQKPSPAARRGITFSKE
jgi:superfamily II RNA helicase